MFGVTKNRNICVSSGQSFLMANFYMSASNGKNKPVIIFGLIKKYFSTTTTSDFIYEEYSQLPKFCKRIAHVDLNIMRSILSCIAC